MLRKVVSISRNIIELKRREISIMMDTLSQSTEHSHNALLNLSHEQCLLFSEQSCLALSQSSILTLCMYSLLKEFTIYS